MSLFAEAVKAEVLVKLKSKLVKSKKLSLGKFLETLVAEERDILMSFALESIFDFSTIEEKQEKEETPATTSFVMDEDKYRADILQFLKEGGLGEERGFKSDEIIAKCGGDKTTVRKALNKLAEEKLVGDTGKTRSQRWVAKEFLKKAEEVFLKKGG